jgi:glycosyltransferase involved in cell wall biosynthesis
MKIAQLTPGSGDNFYCENCLRDAALVRAMRGLGADVLLLPMYLPLQSEKEGRLGSSEVFFGGVNVYLQQKLGFFRKTPRWIDRLFDSGWLLRLVSKKAGMTSARELGETTLSMLRGEQGRQVKELERLIEWLGREENRVDVVILSNALLAGLAKRIKEALGTKVVCLLQDEDGFLDSLGTPYSERCWAELGNRAKDFDFFISVSKYYADVMAERLNISRDKLEVVYTGISLEGFKQDSETIDTPVIGYLSRMCPARGLDVLVDAFIILKQNEQNKDVKLKIAGGQLGSDKVFVDGLRKKILDCGLNDDVEFREDFGTESRLSFLNRLSVLCVPERSAVAYGLYVLEALAAGVAAVEPATGVFKELAEETGGIYLYKRNDAAGAAAAIEKVLSDKEYARQLGQAGKNAVFEKFDIQKTAKDLIGVLEKVRGV